MKVIASDALRMGMPKIKSEDGTKLKIEQWKKYWGWHLICIELLNYGGAPLQAEFLELSC